ncbi:hypothetical protein QBC39DRAFT_373561 [Podospora conica]|nr:hypothetical protein QBC39DRAFT_373561 [Schizothecium conicum]
MPGPNVSFSVLIISIISFHLHHFLTTNSTTLNTNITSTLAFNPNINTLAFNPNTLTLTPNSNFNTFAMAATKITTSAPSFPVPYGRSGYNKDGDDEEEDKCVNQGRSGYNGPAKAEDDEDN